MRQEQIRRGPIQGVTGIGHGGVIGKEKVGRALVLRTQSPTQAKQHRLISFQGDSQLRIRGKKGHALGNALRELHIILANQGQTVLRHTSPGFLMGQPGPNLFGHEPPVLTVASFTATPKTGRKSGYPTLGEGSLDRLRILIECVNPAKWRQTVAAKFVHRMSATLNLVGEADTEYF